MASHQSAHQSPPAPAGFADFLAATVGEERNGMHLSVLSAFARLDMDPWEEARRLADLPKGTAVNALAALIAKLPAGLWEPSEATRIAARLVPLLPKRPAALSRSSSLRTRSGTVSWPWYAAIALALIAALIWFR